MIIVVPSWKTSQQFFELCAAKCDAAGMRMSTSKPQARKKKRYAPSRLKGEDLFQLEEFKYHMSCSKDVMGKGQGNGLQAG